MTALALRKLKFEEITENQTVMALHKHLGYIQIRLVRDSIKECNVIYYPMERCSMQVEDFTLFFGWPDKSHGLTFL